MDGGITVSAILADTYLPPWVGPYPTVNELYSLHEYSCQQQ